MIDKRSDSLLLEDAEYNLIHARNSVDIVEKYLSGVTVDETEANNPDREDVIINKLFYEDIVIRVTKYNVLTGIIMGRINDYKAGNFYKRWKGKRLFKKLISMEHRNEENLASIMQYMLENTDG